MKIESLIVVKDVEESSKFYQYLLQCESGHGESEYEMLMFEGELVLQLHAQDTHDHPGMFDHDPPLGNGILLWFRTDDFDAAVKRVISLNAEIVTEPHINPNAQ